MARFLHLARALGLVAALLLGQQLVVLHDLTHANEQLSRKDGKTGPSTCDQFFACAQLSGAVGASPPVMPADCANHAKVEMARTEDAASAPLLAFRSRAPPTIL
jgi:hypothetical protein